LIKPFDMLLEGLEKKPEAFGLDTLRAQLTEDIFRHLEAIASEADAQFIDDLADDDLPGKPGDPGHTYLGLMKQNLAAMIPALGGDASAVTGLDIGNVFDGASGAVYPQ